MQRSPLELWGGVECTVNRVGDLYFDQFERSGHAARSGDLDLIASTGIRALRYPVDWARTAPDGRIDWTWADERLGRLRELGVRPIVTLTHHGSGPRHTSLVDPGFPAGLAGFARAVAERYPWVDAYTPVNEPLTTARFSGLYGHWYPHGRDCRTFARALLTQCQAIAAAMRAIREAAPGAGLVQTEDTGRTLGTARLAYQAEFENDRRWLSLDLLCGRVDRHHPLWGHLVGWGIAEAELHALTDAPCPPDVVGLNYYLTGDRFLDERTERYPAWSHGGNGRESYTDVEAVRVCGEGIPGHEEILRAAWERYGLPVAFTEVHLGCTREEQLRWLMEAWDAAVAVRAAGGDVRAVTVWSMLGAYDWDSLLTRDTGSYEPGAFDLRGPAPRPTAIARVMGELAAGRRPRHPVLDDRGWWRRAGRFQYPVVWTHGRGPVEDAPGGGRPLLIAGAAGTLGREAGRICRVRGLSHRLMGRREMDIADPASVSAALCATRPWAVLNAAGYVRVDEAEREPAVCRRENEEGPAVLAAACAARGIQLVTFSTDLVFDGGKGAPYVESDPVAPLNEYGRSKAAAESRVLALHAAAMVVRTSAFFGPRDAHNFVTTALRVLAQGRPFSAADDAVVSPTYVPDLVHAALDLLVDGERGVWHLANGGAVTWAELARAAARLAGADPALVEARSTGDLMPAPRPAHSVLGSERGTILPSLHDALGRYIHEREPGSPASAPPRRGSTGAAGAVRPAVRGHLHTAHGAAT